MKITRIQSYIAETIPEKEDMEEGVLYISYPFAVAIHLCCCGCGTETITPLDQHNWKLSIDEGGPTLMPSIGNQRHPCCSHYWIRNGVVIWL